MIHIYKNIFLFGIWVFKIQLSTMASRYFLKHRSLQFSQGKSWNNFLTFL